MAPDDNKIDLLDRLYGEPGDTVDDEAMRGELASYGRLRALMREMPDEEPSPSITAQLLHAAAQSAPARSSARHAAVPVAGVGVWGKIKGLFRPMMMHPGVAAMATLVLVAGIGGALYLRKESKFAEPRVASEAAPAGTPTRGFDSPTVPPTLAEPAPVAEGGRMADLIDPEPGPTPSGSADKGTAAAAERPRPHSGGSARPGGGTKSTGEGEGAIATADNQKADPADSRGGVGGGDEADGVGLVIDGDAVAGGESVEGRSSTTIDVTTAEPPLKMPEPESTTKPADKKTTDSTSAKTTEAQTQTRKAIELAKRGECASVEPIATRVRALDAYVYDTVFLRDASISACRDKPKASK